MAQQCTIPTYPVSRVTDPSPEFAQALHENSNYALDWLFWASRVKTREEQIYCFERAKYIDPACQEAVLSSATLRRELRPLMLHADPVWNVNLNASTLLLSNAGASLGKALVNGLRLCFMMIVLVSLLAVGTTVIAQDACELDVGVETYIAQGDGAFAQGDYMAALEAYTCVINLDPENGDAYFVRHQTYVLTNQWDYAHNDLATGYINAVDPEAMLVTLEQNYSMMIDEMPDSLDGYILRSFLYTWMGRYDEAFADFARILELDSDNAYALVNRAVAHAYVGNQEEAEQDAERAIEVAGDNPHVLGFAGAVYLINGDFETGISLTDRALEVDPNHVSNLLRRARAYRDIGEYETAIADYERALTLDAPPVEE